MYEACFCATLNQEAMSAAVTLLHSMPVVATNCQILIACCLAGSARLYGGDCGGPPLSRSQGRAAGMQCATSASIVLVQVSFWKGSNLVGNGLRFAFG